MNTGRAEGWMEHFEHLFKSLDDSNLEDDDYMIVLEEIERMLSLRIEASFGRVRFVG